MDRFNVYQNDVHYIEQLGDDLIVIYTNYSECDEYHLKAVIEEGKPVIKVVKINL